MANGGTPAKFTLTENEIIGGNLASNRPLDIQGFSADDGELFYQIVSSENSNWFWLLVIVVDTSVFVKPQHNRNADVLNLQTMWPVARCSQDFSLETLGMHCVFMTMRGF